MRAAPAILALVLLSPEVVSAAPRVTRGAPAAARPGKKAVRPSSSRPPTLAEAKAAMTALQRDRSKRRFRHHWDRAITNLERSARANGGRDAAEALLEAARARYALFRWSANDADRDAALSLAAKAAKKGSAKAPALAAAIRREAGDDEKPEPPRRAPAVASKPAVKAAPKAPAHAKPAAPVEEPDDADEPESDRAEAETPTDPALAAALADLQATAADHPERGPALQGGAESREPARVTEVKSWSSRDYTRVAIYLSHWVGWQKLELPASPGQPRRLALDFRPAELDPSLSKGAEVEGRQVDRVRAAQNAADTVRVVLDLPGTEGLHLFTLQDPPRLIVDVGSPEPRPAPADVPVAEAPAREPPLPLPPPPPEAPAARPPQGPGEVRRIVVDAGHGGRDPGAIGPGRVREKDVTLAIAKKLAAKLRGAGFEVVLTRDEDRTLALEERTALANTAGGDIFVSVHANAHPRRNRDGVETYFLNVAADRYAARLAERENGLDLGEGDEQAARILTDLDAKASALSSRRLATLVQQEVTAGVRARVGDVRDLGVKSALFYVLLGARMPAVLVETGFISNREEERRLASARYQDEVASGIARAVTAFSRSAARVAAAR
ncbi:MAG: N-acetylmuramoyl-L-alanine amidase [Anaeromyxobacteraceae bacterium]